MIRPATIEDVAVIAQAHVQSGQETCQQMLYLPILAEYKLDTRLALWLQVLKLNNHILLVTEGVGHIQGFIDVSLSEAKGIAKIIALYVLKAA